MKNLFTIKKLIIPILFLLIFSIPKSDAQKIFVDADSLYRIYKFTGSNTIEIGDRDNPIPMRILSRYATNNPTVTNISAQDLIDIYYKDNPFIGPDGIFKIEKSLQGNPMLRKAAFSGLDDFGTQGADIFDNFAKGLTLFLVDRFKQELSATFFKDFKRKLEKHSDLQILFPHSYKTLSTIEDDVYQFNTYINELRSAFVKDMQSFVNHAEQYLISKEKLLADHPELKFALADAFHLTEMLLEENVDVFEVFKYLGEDAYIQGDFDTDNPTVQDIRGILTFTNEILQTLRSTDQDEIFVGRQHIRDVIRYDSLLIIYCGLQYQRVKHIELGNGVTIADVFTPENRRKIATALREVVAFADNINTYKKELRDAGDNDSLKTEIQYKIYSGVFDMIKSQVNLVKDLAPYTEPKIEVIENYIDLVGTLGDMGFDLRKEHYSSAMVNLSKAITLLPFENSGQAAQVVMKYGTFASEVAEAKSPEEAKDVIERYAMPVGGSSRKKRSRFDMSLNAYMGLAGGSETLYTDSTSHVANYVAFAAPVGIAVSTGLGKGGSVSLFFPIIDVGALATYRLNDNNFDNLPKLKFSNVFSPGGYLVYGAGNDIPISIGLGVQMGPNLRGVTNDAQFDVTEARGFRMGAFLAVDIPIFSIYSKGR